MSNKILRAIALVLAESTLIFWMFVNTFITGSIGLALVFTALVFGIIQYYKYPQIRGSRISDSVLSLFHIDENDLRKNTIFHKGGAALAPENTMEAIRKAIEIGVAGVEVDVNFSKDGVCVLFHGPELSETTEGTGLVNQHTFSDLQKLNASAKIESSLKEKYPVTRIPKLEECVIECVRNNMLIFFDCKGDPTLTATALAELYKNYPELYRLGVACSFYPQTIYATSYLSAEDALGICGRQIISIVK